MARKRVILSDTEDGDPTEAVNDSTALEAADPPSRRPSRKTKEGAKKKWESLVPGHARKKKKGDPESLDGDSEYEAAESPSKASQKSKGKAPRDEGRDQPDTRIKHDQSTTRRHGRRINPDTSSGEEWRGSQQVSQDKRKPGQRKAGYGGTKQRSADVDEDNAQQVAPPTVSKSTPISHRAQHQSSTDDNDSQDGSRSDDESGEADKTDDEDVGLVRMEKNPRALEHMFAQETPRWVNGQETSSPERPQPPSRKRPSPDTQSRYGSHPPPTSSREPSESAQDDLDSDSAIPRLSSHKIKLPATGSKRAVREDSSDGSDIEAPPPKKPLKLVSAQSDTHRDGARGRQSHGPRGRNTHTKSQTTDKATRPKKQPTKDNQRAKSVREDEIPKFRKPGSDEDAPSDHNKSRGKERSAARATSKAPSQSKMARARTARMPASDSEDSAVNGVPASDSSSDESSIDLVPPEQGKYKLTQQHSRVRRVVDRGIDLTLVEIALKNAFPDGPQKNSQIVYRALLRAAEELDYTDIFKRVKKKDNYMVELSRLVSQRISTFRGSVRRLVDGQPSTAFGLNFGDRAKGDWLQEGLRYIYPFDYESKTIKANKAYSPPVYIETIRAAWFKQADSFGFEIANRFESSLPDKPDEKELPAPMLALVATALHAAIDDCKKGLLQARKFTANDYWSVYTEHIQTLSNIRSTGTGRQYHALMHGLWCQISAPMSATGNPGAPRKSFLDAEAMAIE